MKPENTHFPVSSLFSKQFNLSKFHQKIYSMKKQCKIQYLAQ